MPRQSLCQACAVPPSALRGAHTDLAACPAEPARAEPSRVLAWHAGERGSLSWAALLSCHSQHKALRLPLALLRWHLRHPLESAACARLALWIGTREGCCRLSLVPLRACCVLWTLWMETWAAVSGWAGRERPHQSRAAQHQHPLVLGGHSTGAEGEPLALPSSEMGFGLHCCLSQGQLLQVTTAKGFTSYSHTQCRQPPGWAPLCCCFSLPPAGGCEQAALQGSPGCLLRAPAALGDATG